MRRCNRDSDIEFNRVAAPGQLTRHLTRHSGETRNDQLPSLHGRHSGEFVKTLLEMSDSFRVLPHLVALSIAYVLALPIGWNRERAERSAGLRTFPLVALATCGIVQATEGFLNGHPEGTARIIEGLMTGMGFIGGGAILKDNGSVRGTATAASLWATGATGAAVGLGAYDVAVVVSLFTFLTLWLLVPFKTEEHQQHTEN
jgi:putative Mg2+ transporter-C (MgtC) family protein